MPMTFSREETPTIQSGLVVRWQGEVLFRNYPEISASREGVLISGAWPIITDPESIETIKRILDEAVTIHKRMAGKCGRYAEENCDADTSKP